MGKEFAQIIWHLIPSAGLRTEPATPRPLCNLLSGALAAQQLFGLQALKAESPQTTQLR